MRNKTVRYILIYNREKIRHWCIYTQTTKKITSIDPEETQKWNLSLESHGIYTVFQVTCFLISSIKYSRLSRRFYNSAHTYKHFHTYTYAHIHSHSHKYTDIYRPRAMATAGGGGNTILSSTFHPRRLNILSANLTFGNNIAPCPMRHRSNLHVTKA